MDNNLKPDKSIQERVPDKENHQEIINKQEKIKSRKDDSKELKAEDNKKISEEQTLEMKQNKMVQKLKQGKDKAKILIAGDLAHEKAMCTLMILKGAMMVAGIVLVSWCENTKSNKSCDIQEAVESLRLNFTVPCKYENTKDDIETIWEIGISSFILDFLFLILSLFLWLVPPKIQRTGHLTFYFTYATQSLVISVLLLVHHKDIVDSKRTQIDTDFGRLKIAMIDSLTDNYASDVITINDTISDGWNIFFIKYDCCAVNQVSSTTNDFDTTPWCTTSGSCQATNSQIPYSCCKDVTVNDYQDAPYSCHATVSAGTYKDSCFTRMRTLSNVAITEYQIDVVASCLFTLEIMKVAAILLSVVLTVICSLCKENENSKINHRD